MSGAVLVESSRESCQCADCVGLCRRVPGFFKPGEAEHAAKLLGLAFPVFVRTMLDVAEIPDTSATGLRPKMANGGGRCVFLTPSNRCAIHAAKPFECREAWCMDMHGSDREPAYLRCSREWYAPEHQAQIQALLTPRQSAVEESSAAESSHV